MPTPVSTARQCLTPEAAHALDEAVSVARRRGHGQTTSLHAVSALLNLPSSILRDACARARNAAYSPRLQFKALELCLSVSLDRVSASQLDDDPPVSNSLMAAIKRSQANQRRQPENFHLYHQISQQQSSASSISCIKVELPNLILSILDDPVVSRVFGEAGFRSSEIKLAIVRPLPRVFKFSRFKSPPLFLCNLSENLGTGPGPGQMGFNFPFQSYSGFSNGDEDHRRIGEILSRNRGRNPLLVGACAYDTLASFNEWLEKRKQQGILPVRLSGLGVICIERDIATFVNENSDKCCIDLRFQDVDQFVKQSMGPGLVVNFGDLKTFVSSSNDAVACIVENLTRLLQLHGGKVWLIGAASNNETYVKFVGKFPSIEKDWALQLLPITSFRAPMAESYPRSSLMDSFVPFGGFFSMPSDLNDPLSTSCHCMPRCQLCTEKCDQEVLAVSKGGYAASVADQYQSGLPSWLQMAEFGKNRGLDLKTRDDGVVLSFIVAGIHKKWDNICQRLHHTQPARTNIHPSHFPTIMDFQPIDDRRKDAENHSSCDTYALTMGNKSVKADSCTFDNQNISKKQDGVLFPMISEANGDNVLSREWGKPSKEDFESGGLKCHGGFSNLSIDGSQTSPTSMTLTTELGLTVTSVPALNTPRKAASQRQIEFLGDISGSFRANVDVSSGSVSDHLAQSSSSSSPDLEIDLNNFKMLFRALTERIGWQDEAIRVISQTIVRCRMTNRKRQTTSLRGDIWLNFLGPDRCGKRKIAIALAEIIYGRKDNFISADLSPEVGTMHTCMLIEEHAVMFRGKTVVDYVAGELCKKPASVVFLENLEKADVQARNILSHAIESGKFSDSHGREVGINNAIFITTSTFPQDTNFSPEKNIPVYSEDKILMARGQSMRLLIEPALGCQIGKNLNIPHATKKDKFSSIVVNKRKLIGPNQNLEQHELSDIMKRANRTSTRNLDLNLPAQGNENLGTEDGDSAEGSVFDNSRSWLQNFFEKVDGMAVFRPYDFDNLAERILSEINESFQKFVGSECLLEIDPKVIEQLLAAAYLSEKDGVVGDWVEQVLSCGFVEAQRRYNLTAHCTVKLVTFKDQHAGEHMAGVHLPSKIFTN